MVHFILSFLLYLKENCSLAFSNSVDLDKAPHIATSDQDLN